MRGIEERGAEFYRVQKVERRSIAAQIMDWADDITYAVHDVEDFFRIGIIPLDELRRSRFLFDEFLEYAWPKVRDKVQVDQETMRGWLQETKTTLLPREAYTGSRRDRENLHGFASRLIKNAIESVTVVDDGILLPSREQVTIIEMFKLLTWYYVLEGVSLSSVRRGQVRLVRELYRDLIAWVQETYDTSARRSLPARLLNYRTRCGTPADYFSSV